MGKRTVKKKKGELTANNSLLSKPSYLGDKDIPMLMELIQYDSAHVDVKNISLQTSIKGQIDKTKVNWLKIAGISDASLVDRICRDFGLHGFDVKDMLADQQLVKVVAYDKVLFVLLSSFYVESDNTVDDIQVAFILGKNFIVSFEESPISAFEEVKKNVEENNVSIRQKSSDFLLYVLLNAVNVSNINALIYMEEQLSDIEEQLIEKKNPANILQYLHLCRVDYIHMKRSVISLREEYSNLLHNNNQLIRSENIVYFNDFDDRMRTLIDNLASFHESLTSLSDLYYNNNNLKLNEIIKRLTIVSTIFIPLTFIVGVWGMNFEFMPELNWKYGYLFAWTILALAALFTFIWMKKQKWF